MWILVLGNRQVLLLPPSFLTTILTTITRAHAAMPRRHVLHPMVVVVRPKVLHHSLLTYDQPPALTYLLRSRSLASEVGHPCHHFWWWPQNGHWWHAVSSAVRTVIILYWITEHSRMWELISWKSIMIWKSYQRYLIFDSHICRPLLVVNMHVWIKLQKVIVTLLRSVECFRMHWSQSCPCGNHKRLKATEYYLRRVRNDCFHPMFHTTCSYCSWSPIALP